MFDLIYEVSIDLHASNSFIVISKGSSSPLCSSHDRYDPRIVRYALFKGPLRSS